MMMLTWICPAFWEKGAARRRQRTSLMSTSCARLLYSARPSKRRGLSGDGVEAYRLYMVLRAYT